MARIIKTSEQVIALKTIRDDLKNLDSINSLLDEDVKDLSLVFTREGKKRKLPISKKNIRQLLSKLQKKSAAEIRATAEMYNIDLSKKDDRILRIAEGENPDSEEQEAAENARPV